MEVSRPSRSRTFDSNRDGRARWTPHSAFDDPNSSSDAPPRESIEMRTMAFFELHQLGLNKGDT